MADIKTRFNVELNGKYETNCGPSPADDSGDGAFRDFALKNATIEFILKNSVVTDVQIRREAYTKIWNGESKTGLIITANVITQDPIIYPTIDEPTIIAAE